MVRVELGLTYEHTFVFYFGLNGRSCCGNIFGIVGTDLEKGVVYVNGDEKKTPIYSHLHVIFS